jgi:hypothetical protein
MSIYNTLRAIPTRVAEMLAERGYMRDLSEEDKQRMEADLSAITEEWFGESKVKVEEKQKKEKKTKAAVVSATPATVDRAYLETLTVSDLKQLGKDCAAIKGRKPRAELIEIVLQHLSGSPVTEQVPVEASEAGSDEELREEAPPVPPTEDKAKKEKKAPAKKEKAVKEKKEKAPKK